MESPSERHIEDYEARLRALVEIVRANVRGSKKSMAVAALVEQHVRALVLKVAEENQRVAVLGERSKRAEKLRRLA